MKKTIKWLIKCGFTIALFILIFKPSLLGIQHQFIPVSLKDLWKEITAIDFSTFWVWILIATIIKATGMFCSILRWDVLLKGQGIKLSLKHLIGTFLTGRFFGMFLPSTIGLDGYRLFDVGKQTGKWVESTAVIAVEKLIGFIALTFLVFITLPLGARLFTFKPIVLVITLFILGGFVLFSLILLFNPTLIRTLIGIMPLPGRSKIEGKLQKVSQATTIYSGQKLLLTKAIVLGFMVHLCTSLMYFGTAMAIRSPNIHILDILFTSPLMIYGTVLGPSIGGEGIRELMFAIILGSRVGHAKAILFSHLGFWVGELLSLPGGIIYLLRPAEYRARFEELKNIPETTPDQAEEAERQERYKTAREKIGNRLKIATLSGLLAGSLIGLLESVVLIIKFTQLEEYTTLYYSVISYGIIGLLMGFGFSILGSIVALAKQKEDDYPGIASFYFSWVFCPLALIISRFLITRDILQEKPLTLIQNLVLLGGVVVLFFLIRTLVKILIRTRSAHPAAGSKGVLVKLAGSWICLLGGAIAASFLLATPRTTSQAPASIPQSLLDKPNVILIMVDTLRADHLSCYGYKNNSTPNIDRFASDSVLYKNTFGQSSWTKPQGATLLTSLYPSSHNTYLKPHILPDEIETLPEIMRSLRFYTLGIVNVIHFSPGFNFNQGFDRYHYLAPDFFFYAQDSSSHLCLYNILRLIRARFLSKQKQVNHYYQDAQVVNQLAFDWLEDVKASRFFLFLHYMDPHDPYFTHPYNGEGVARVSTPKPNPDQAGEIEKLYDGEVSYLDHHFGKLIDFLKEAGLYDNTLILLTADHGEEFFEHGGWWHGLTLYDEQIYIPLIIKYPKGQNRGIIKNEIVRTLDIAPTILDYVNSQVPQTMQGTSLLREYHLRSPQDQRVFSEENHENNILQSVRSDTWKFIRANQNNPRGLSPQELYNIAEDPEEKNNRAASKRDKAGQLEAEINSYLDFAKGKSAREKVGTIDQTTEDRLRALGYVD